MLSKQFLTLFISTNIAFIFFHIHKQVRSIHYAYTLQKNEKNLALLHQQKNNLLQQLYTLKDRTIIKHYAEQELGMKPITYNQCKSVPPHVQNQLSN